MHGYYEHVASGPIRPILLVSPAPYLNQNLLCFRRIRGDAKNFQGKLMQQQKAERHMTATGNLKSSLINFKERFVCI